MRAYTNPTWQKKKNHTCVKSRIILAMANIDEGCRTA